ncbi:hypothetical protein L1987_55066 [Smallanthus sonchifolius]|uniref:Uncharacterized protein n=1 Tax=Smallanthus sonchifolius TaxID=185202 RepID=A0ACB9E9B6_9ASTR|nr:hypothetical protein L1987_55066 [Smallanthus sonchifolius]
MLDECSNKCYGLKELVDGIVVGKAILEGRKWYYYSMKTHNRITENGYWKAWDGEEGIISSNGDHKRIGVKKYYVFHIGEAPHGTKTKWIMEEFRVIESNRATTSGVGQREDLD